MPPRAARFGLCVEDEEVDVRAAEVERRGQPCMAAADHHHIDVPGSAHIWAAIGCNVCDSKVIVSGTAQ